MSDQPLTELVDLLRDANPVLATDVAGSNRSMPAEALFEAILAGSVVAPPWWRRRGLATLAPGAVRHENRSFADPTTPALEAIQLLRSANPVPAGAVAGSGASMRAEAILDGIVHGRRNAPVPRWRRRGVLTTAAGVIALAGSAAGVTLANRPASGVRSVACFAADSLQAQTAGAILDQSAIASCAGAWQNGAFGTGSAPELVACLLPSGIVGVFPGSSNDVCTQLGLAWPLPPSASARAAQALSLNLRNDLLEVPCLSRESAQAIVESEFSRLGLASWRIVLGTGPGGSTFNRANLCATAVVDVADSTVELVPTPAPATAPTGPATAPTGPATAPTGPATAPTGPATAPSGPATAPSGPATAPSGSANTPTTPSAP